MKYIDAERLTCLLDAKYKDFIGKAKIKGYTTLQYQYMADGIDIAEQLIDSLQQEQLPGIEENGIPGKDFIPVGWVDACEKYGKWKIVKVEKPDFPTTDEQIKEFLATHPKIEVPEKYKNPDWLFKKQEQPEVDLEKASRNVYESWMGGTMNDVRRDMVELGKNLNARKV